MKKNSLLRLIQIAGTKKWWLIFSMILAILSTIAQFVPFVSIYKILVELAKNASEPNLINREYIWFWGYVALAGVLLFGILLYASMMLSHIAAFNILYELRVLISKKLVKLPLGFFSNKSSGQIKKVMSEDVERVELFIAHHIPDITSAILFPILLIIYMFYTDWHLAIVVLSVFFIAIIFQSFMMLTEKNKKLYKKYQHVLGKMNGSIVEYIKGVAIVKIFSKSREAFQKLNSDIKEYKDLSIDVTKQYAPIYVGYYTILSSILLFLIPVSIYLLINSNSYSEYIPKLLFFLILGGGIFFPLMKLMWMSSFMMQNSVGIGLIDDILNMEEIIEPSNSKKIKNSSIIFKDVEFSYEKTPILKKISFEAFTGTITALVGPSGSGKSTIAMLIARFWDIQSGDILIGDRSIKSISSKELMDNISFVFQENTLFFDTIEENIRMGNKDVSFDDVISAAKTAQCHEFIEKLPNGYKTLVGEGGTYLSGGEQQRVSLARAILKNSPILLLDEATAYADPENEGKIVHAISHLIKGKTVIIVAHRLSTITTADQILVINNGQIVEKGKHEDLVTMNGGVYRHMWELYSQSREWVIGGR